MRVFGCIFFIIAKVKGRNVSTIEQLNPFKGVTEFVFKWSVSKAT